MPYCKKCGNKLSDTANFCNKCGSPVAETKAETSRDEAPKSNIPSREEPYKCPFCGEILEAFLSVCPTCGNELRGVKGVKSLTEFSAQLAAAETLKQKIDLIRVFPIPNTKEDIFEFMVLACSNFDAAYYVTHIDQEDVSDAWLSKIEQCYHKAGYIFPTDPAFVRIKYMYDEIQSKIRNHIAEAKRVTSSNAPISRNNEIQKKNTSGGYSSWSGFAKFCWIILNLYMCGIPAIIYYLTRNK